MNDTEQHLAKIHEILYKFEQNSHRHRIDSLSEKQMTTKLATEKAQAAEAIADFLRTSVKSMGSGTSAGQPAHPVPTPVDGEIEQFIKSHIYGNFQPGADGEDIFTATPKEVRDFFAAHLQAAIQAARIEEQQKGASELAAALEPQKHHLSEAQRRDVEDDLRAIAAEWLDGAPDEFIKELTDFVEQHRAAKSGELVRHLGFNERLQRLKKEASK